jgi:hypothetical protein
MKTKSMIKFINNVGVKLDFTLNSIRYRAEVNSAPTKKHSFKSCTSINPINPDSEILSKICVIL